MTLPRPGHPPTSPTVQDPISDVIGTLAVLGQAAIDALPAGTLALAGNAAIGIGLSIGVSRNISILGDCS